MRPSILVPLVAGLGAGVFALYMLLSAFEDSKAQAAKPTEHVTVVVAKTEIPYAIRITADMLGVIEVAKPSPFTDTLSTTEEAVGRVSALRIAPGMPVVVSALAAENTPPGARHQIPAGLRTVALRIDAFSVSGIEPGDRVDVLFASGKVRSRMRDMRTILQNVEVFSVGDKMPGMGMALSVKDAKKKQKAPNETRRGGDVPVRLLLTPERAKKLTTADINGDIRLQPRAFGDDTVLVEAELTDAEPAPESVEETVAHEAAPPPTHPVQLIHGGKVEKREFPIDGASSPRPRQSEAATPRAGGERSYVPDLKERAAQALAEKDIGD